MDTTTDPVLAAIRASAAVRRQQTKLAALKATAGKQPEAYAAAVNKLAELVDRHTEAVRAAVSAGRS